MRERKTPAPLPPMLPLLSPRTRGEEAKKRGRGEGRGIAPLIFLKRDEKSGGTEERKSFFSNPPLDADETSTVPDGGRGRLSLPRPAHSPSRVRKTIYDEEQTSAPLGAAARLQRRRHAQRGPGKPAPADVPGLRNRGPRRRVHRQHAAPAGGLGRPRAASAGGAAAHRGIVAALQAGLALCRAPLVARMDADDIALPQRLAAQVAFLETHPQVAVVGTQVEPFPPQRVGPGLRRYLAWQNALLDDAAIRREIFIESPFTHPSVVFRREAVLAVGGYRDPGWPEDYDLWLRLYLAGARFGKVPQVLLRWRERPHRLTRIDPRCSGENFQRAKAFYLAHGPLAERDAVFLWGAGPTGRRLGRLLLAFGVPVRAYLDIDPKKIGRTRHGLPIHAPEDLPRLWRAARRPALVAAVGALGARALIRQRLTVQGLREGEDWWFAA